MNQALKSLLQEHLEFLKNYRVRQLIVYLGETQWAQQQIGQITNDFAQSLTYSDSDKVQGEVSKRNLHQYLGTEADFVAIYTDAFEPTPFALLAGVIKAGGICFLAICPKNLQTSRFANYFLEQCRQSEFHLVIEQSMAQSMVGELLAKSRDAYGNGNFGKGSENKHSKHNALCLTHEQDQAVSLLLQHHHNNTEPSTIVLTADRGRGKSSALAIFTASLLVNDSQSKRVVITAPKKTSVAIFFQQLVQTLRILTSETTLHETLISRVSFHAVDDIALNTPQADLLLIDEASGIPVPILERFVAQYEKTVFATTVHGYEGAGRGFVYKFLNHLVQRQKTTGLVFEQFHMNEPIRWSQECPLEQFTFDTLLLNAEISNARILMADNKSTQVIKLDKDLLLNNHQLLREVFALLVSAHYQTSTSDFKLLLDHELLDIHGMMIDETLVGVALMVRELAIPELVREGVIAGNRRVRDHFTAQSVVQHLGFNDAVSLSFYRVMRIAIHPDLQGHQLGSQLMSEIESYAKTLSIDALSTSFGVNSSLLNFWQNNQFNLIRLGMKKDHASAEFSGLFVKPLTKAAGVLNQRAEQEFYRGFQTLLPHVWQDLDTKIVKQLRHHVPSNQQDEITAYDLQSLADFAYGKRLLLNCLPSIKRVLIDMRKHGKETRFPALAQYVFEQPSVQEICNAYSLTGKKAFNQYCQKACVEMIEQGYRLA